LKEKSEELHKVAQVLLEKEVIVKDDMVELIGERPFEETKPIPEVKEESAPANENANTQQLEDSNPSEDEKPAGEA